MKTIIITVVALAALWASPAVAAEPRNAPAAAASGAVSPPCLPIDLRPECKNNPATISGKVATTLEDIGQQIQRLEKQIVDKAILDTQAASQDASLRNDQISKPCWDAETQFLQLLPVEWVANPGDPTKTPPIPATPGAPSEVGPALGLQISRDLINAITGSDKTSLKVACAAMVGDQVKIVNQLLALVGIKAGLATIGIIAP